MAPGLAPRGDRRSPPLAAPKALLLAALAGLLFGVVLGSSFKTSADRPPETPGLPAADAERLAQVLRRVRTDYVDAIDEHALMEAALKGMISALDAHSALLTAADHADLRVTTVGSYTGVGIEVENEAGELRVAETLAGSPAALAGIRAGDRLLAVDGAAVDGQHLTAELARLRGVAGSQVGLLLARGTGGARYALKLERRPLELRTVQSAALAPSIGYLRIRYFGDSTRAEVERAVDELRAATGGARLALVLDLRDNPGGLLDAGVAVADAFLERGLIVRGEGRASDAQFERYAQPGDLVDGAPIAILVNARTASAAEIVAAALKDNHRATVLGQPSYGKGTVQSLFALADGRALKLTTARCFRPSGASLAEHGIAPDVLLPESTPRRPGEAGEAPALDREVLAAAAALRTPSALRLAGL